RPGDVDATGVSGLEVPAFELFAQLAGKVPLVGIAAGYCFAGNAALLGMCDVVIATEDSHIGMGGPAMIEGGGLGAVAPTEIGPIGVQAANGTVDVVASDEAHAVSIAKSALALLMGTGLTGTPGVADAADQSLLRDVVPERRTRVYEVRRVIELLADTASVIELRRGVAPGMVTSLARIGGRAVGVFANDPEHLGGAIDAAACDAAADFLELCDTFSLPVVSLCDTPGFMVGAEAEREATVRRAGRMFRVAANLSVPLVMVVLRKCYGLGAQAMGGGSLKAPDLCVAWPTGEFGGMGLEGAVRLGFRKELEAIDDPDERARTEAEMIALAYERGSALNIASHFEIDDVIDPADTRRVIIATLSGSVPG
ncbi:MAG TPA: carboxyl transferase domain-containing protein, partial [Microthrixaceae bacterium]|nr:carboxyl transferase domain-containing protein [Microthrixaceae bacterium]